MKNSQTWIENRLFNRRAFLGISTAAGLSLLSGGLTQAASKTEQSHQLKPIGGATMKSWAKENLRGGEAFILPSLRPDLKNIDEEGVRRDVRHSIAQGFCSIMPLPIGLDKKNVRLMYKIVAEEAKGKIFTVNFIRPGKWGDMADRVHYMESLGFSHAMMYFNPKLPDQKAIYDQMHSVIEKTSLGIVLYAKPVEAIKPMDPTGLPLDTFDRLADLDKVIGVKFTQTLRPATAYALAERVGDRLLLGVINLELMLPLSLKYRMQWTGQWGIDCLQSPDKPWVNQFLELLSSGKNREAYDLYWQYEPIASAFYELQEPSLRIGGHPWVHIKYMKWLTGGNGGLLPDLKAPVENVPHLNAEGRSKCRKIFDRVGIKVVDLPDEAFVVGNAAYENGVRPQNMAGMPQYIS